MNNDLKEKSLVIIKNDGLNHLSEIIQKFEQSRVTIIAIKTINIDVDSARKLYKAHQGQYFFNALVDYMSQGTSIVIVVEANNDFLIKTKKELRNAIKSTPTEDSLEEIQSQLNSLKIDKEKYIEEYQYTFDVLHCSDSSEGEKEILLFFQPEELDRKTLSSKQKSDIIINKIKTCESSKAGYSHYGKFGENSNHNSLEKEKTQVQVNVNIENKESLRITQTY